VEAAVEAAVAASQAAAAPAGAPTLSTTAKLSATANARLTEAFDRIGHWLSGLPANPVTDFLTGALLLVRRNLLPEVVSVTQAPQAVVTAVAGTSPSLTNITYTPGSTSLVLTFSTPLVRDSATDLANYSITAPTLFGNPAVVSRGGLNLRILAAEYTDISETSSQVTLTLKRPMWQGYFYRISIKGELPVTSGNPDSNPVSGIGAGRTTFDGDNDGTPGGNFWGLFGVGPRLTFYDSNRDRVTLTATGGAMNVWRELTGDINQITVLPGATALSGKVVLSKETTGTVYIGAVEIPVAEPLVLNGAANTLPDTFEVVPAGGLAQPPPVATQISPTPIVATSQNLPYTLIISPINAPGTENLPNIQSAVYFQTAPTSEHPQGLVGYFGGRTSGRHAFFFDDASNFPPSFQNQSIYVIDPVSYEVWSMPWSQTDVPASMSNSLSATNQQYYQKGDKLYVVGGYSRPNTVSFTGDVTAGSDLTTVTDGLDKLQVGQSVSGIVREIVQVYPANTTITAINGNIITTSNPAVVVVGESGLSLVASKGDYTTYDTLTALSVSGLAEAVINGNAADLSTLANIRQISDPRMGMTGGVLTMVDGRAILTFGQNFQGALSGTFLTASVAQVYTNEVRSFRIVDIGSHLAIADYKAQRDTVNGRRRDGNLVPLIGPDGRPKLAYLGGVFTVDNGGYQAPILIDGRGNFKVAASYQQFFSQYSTAHFSLYDRRSGNNYAVLMGGISLYDYSDGQLTSDTTLPWTDNVTSIVQASDGSFQEYIMDPIPAPFPGGTGLYGAYAAWFQNQALPTYGNGVIKLDKLTGPTVLGYLYGGIHSNAPTPVQRGTVASNKWFQVVLTPTGAQTT
jgi:hypothetical protein